MEIVEYLIWCIKGMWKQAYELTMEDRVVGWSFIMGSFILTCIIYRIIDNYVDTGSGDYSILVLQGMWFLVVILIFLLLIIFEPLIMYFI